jgi:hypothetical protein
VNLERHVAVLWRYRWLTALGTLLALVLGFLAAYQIDQNGLQRRGSEEWTSLSQIFVTQEGFPWGRVTLPNADPALGQAPQPQPSDSKLRFADPTRFTNLGFLYSFLTKSDQVRGQLPGPPAPGQIEAVPLDPTGRGDAFLPIIQLTTIAETPAKALELNKLTLAGLDKLLREEQDKAKIAQKDRVVLNTLSKPSEPALIAGRSLTPSILAFMLCLIATIALAHILEGLRQARARRQAALEWDKHTTEALNTDSHDTDPAVDDWLRIPG